MQKPLQPINRKKVSHPIESYKAYIKERRTIFVKERLRQFDSLKALDSETKSKLRHHIASYEVQFATTNITNKELNFINLIVGFVGSLILIITVLSTNFFHIPFLSFFSSDIHNPLYLVLSFLLVEILVIPLWLIVRLYSGLVRYVLLNKYMMAIIIGELISILVYEENNPESWTKLVHKRRLLEVLERIAKYVEYNLPRRLRSGDIATDTWIKDTMKQVASALRKKKKWVLTPKKDTRDYFIQSIASTLICFVEGNWDALERVEQAKLTSHQLRNKITGFLLKALRTALIAMLPLVGFLLFQQTSFALTGTSLSTALTLIIIYEISVIGVALNPNFSTTIANIKDIKNLWR